MDYIYYDELENVEMNNMLGSESVLCNCFYKNKFYLYKQPHAFYAEDALKMQALASISVPYLLTPEKIVYGTLVDRPIGYLLPYLENYQSLYNLDLSRDEKIKLLYLVKENIIKMHKLDLIHTDLHLANIMFCGDDIKIIDFDSSQFHGFRPSNYNFYTKVYLSKNILGISVDVFNFNIDTFACINNITWDHVFNYDFSIKLTKEQKRVWQKTKEKKELTYDDFLIDRY